MKRRKPRLKNLIFVFFLFFFIWVLLQFIAPFALPSGSVSELSGIVGFSDNENVIQRMSFPWNVVYSSGDRLCHQRAERSLFLNVDLFDPSKSKIFNARKKLISR